MAKKIVYFGGTSSESAERFFQECEQFCEAQGWDISFWDEVYRNTVPEEWFDMEMSSHSYSDGGFLFLRSSVAENLGFESNEEITRQSSVAKIREEQERLLAFLRDVEYKPGGVTITFSPNADPIELSFCLGEYTDQLEIVGKPVIEPGTMLGERWMRGMGDFRYINPKPFGHDLSVRITYNELESTVMEAFEAIHNKFGIRLHTRDKPIGEKPERKKKRDRISTLLLGENQEEQEPPEPSRFPCSQDKLRVITSLSPKGGIGKTDVLTTLSLYLAMGLPSEVRLFDCDWQATQYLTVVGNRDGLLLPASERDTYAERLLTDPFQAPGKGIQKVIGRGANRLGVSNYPITLFTEDRYYKPQHRNAFHDVVSGIAPGVDFLLVDMPPSRLSEFDVRPLSDIADSVDRYYFLLVTRPIHGEVHASLQEFEFFRQLLINNGIPNDQIYPILVLNFSAVNEVIPEQYDEFMIGSSVPQRTEFDDRIYAARFPGVDPKVDMPVVYLPEVIRDRDEMTGYTVGTDVGFTLDYRQYHETLRDIISEILSKDRTRGLVQKIDDKKVASYKQYGRNMRYLLYHLARDI